MPSGTAIESVVGWQDGFLFMPPVVNPSGSPTLIVVNTLDGLDRGTIVWRGTPGAQQLHLIYTPGNLQGEGPFTAWRQLAPAGVQANPPASTGGLIIGGAAIVNTTQGDKLNVRSGPGRTFLIVARLDAGTRVTLLEGPRSADGLTWWRIRTPSGAEGWVIESIVDQGAVIQTLIPA
ncbi:MAG: SH3 domain-containing protein [Anaerolineae bacterium]|nr:SH3 domain-containing protein [Anaerolineae bacterium]